MKSFWFTFFLFLGLGSYAQTDYDCKLWGLAADGGSNNAGTIFSYDINDETLMQNAAFLSIPYGFGPMGSLCLGSDGLFYGTAWGGGAGMWSQSGTSCNGCGTLFSFDPKTDSLKKLYDFDYDNSPGGLPSGGPIQANNGKLYGMTSTGINNQGGGIYEYNIQSQTLNTLRLCNSVDVYSPQGTLLQASNGLLYGMTEGGGSFNVGVVFSYNINTGLYSTLIEFNGSNGNKPLGELIQGNDSLLYGMTPSGGQNNHGVLFSYNISTQVYTKIYDFLSAAGGYCPQGSLLQANNGKLYGLCSKGGAYNYGTLFEFDLTSGTYYNRFDFSYTNGKIPLGSLLRASNGKLYGVTSIGGAASLGVLFEYDVATGNFSKKADFSDSVGSRPRYIRLIETCTEIPGPLVVTAPNIFTPNGDGINDTWSPIVKHADQLKEIRFFIYNRWGTKVFEGDQKNGWSGNSYADGTYYYVLQYTDLSGKTGETKGFLTLTR